MTPADMDKVREALKPFAKASGLFVCDKTSAMEVIVHPAFTLGELQRASEAIALLAEQPRQSEGWRDVPDTLPDNLGRGPPPFDGDLYLLRGGVYGIAEHIHEGAVPAAIG